MQLLVNGATVAGMFPGVSTSGPITLRFLETPNVPVPKPPEQRLPAPVPAVKAPQRLLIALGYLLPGDDDGRFGPATQNAILAFQKWERLDRTGLLDGGTKSRLATAVHPSPRTHGGAGKREFGDVPAYPASHGCVRQSTTVASWTYGFAYVGMPVKVIAGS